MPLPLKKLDQVIYRLERFKPWYLKNIRIFRSIEMPGRKSATISSLDGHLDNPPGTIAFPGVQPIQNLALGNTTNHVAIVILTAGMRWLVLQYVILFFPTQLPFQDEFWRCRNRCS